MRAVFSQQKFDAVVETVAAAAWDTKLISLCCKSAWVHTHAMTPTRVSDGAPANRCSHDADWDVVHRSDNEWQWNRLTIELVSLCVCAFVLGLACTGPTLAAAPLRVC